MFNKKKIIRREIKTKLKSLLGPSCWFILELLKGNNVPFVHGVKAHNIMSHIGNLKHAWTFCKSPVCCDNDRLSGNSDNYDFERRCRGLHIFVVKRKMGTLLHGFIMPLANPWAIRKLSTLRICDNYVSKTIGFIVTKYYCDAFHSSPCRILR